ncbi:MAG: hypothetical protein V3T21_02335 [Candidatus Margulisiibacteriota bacterium]
MVTAGARMGLAEKVRRPFLSQMALKKGINMDVYNLAKRIRIKNWRNFRRGEGLFLEKLSSFERTNRSKIKLEIAQALLAEKIKISQRGTIEIEPFSESDTKNWQQDFFCNRAVFLFVGFKYKDKTVRFAEALIIQRDGIRETFKDKNPEYFTPEQINELQTESREEIGWADKIKHPWLSRAAKRPYVNMDVYNLAKRLRVKPWRDHGRDSNICEKGSKKRAWQLGLIKRGNVSKFKLELAKYMIENKIALPAKGPVKVEPISESATTAYADYLDIHVDFLSFKYKGKNHTFPSPVRLVLEK